MFNKSGKNKASSKGEKIIDCGTKKRRRCIPGYIAWGISAVIATILQVAARWFGKTYNMGTKELIYTLTNTVKGASTAVIMDIIRGIVVPSVLILLLLSFLAFLTMDTHKTDKLFGRFKGTDVRRLMRWTGAFLTVIYCLFAVKCVDDTLQIKDYIKYASSCTRIYERNYVDPATAHIKPPEEKKNLVYLYMESMETSYASIADGGLQEENYMPFLTQLAGENTSFSDKDGKMGGFGVVPGTGWTMGALLATSSGVPYAFPVDENDMSEYEEFAPRMTTLGDILEDNGYTNEFLCGSDAEFGGRKHFFTQHGNYKIYDYYTAIENGDIPSDYKVWWGFEDAKLYEIAKKEITRLAESGQPFNFTFLTVDTHHMKGYVCEKCDEIDENIEDGQTAAVVCCADRQVWEFVEWLKAQPFWEDTVLVITGDHPRMDRCLVSSADYDDRMVYNCIINSDRETNNNKSVLVNRKFNAMDIFPTVLYALDFNISGNRLGLGTNMYSGKKTLTEEMGVVNINTELSKESEFYLNRFWK